MEAFGQTLAAGAALVFLALLWIATTAEINRLEAVLLVAADQAAEELAGKEENTHA
jgi:hypothetical protein